MTTWSSYVLGLLFLRLICVAPVTAAKSAVCNPKLPLAHVAHEHLRFMNRHIGVADQGRQVIDHVSLNQSFVAPVPGQTDVMDRPIFQLVGSNSPCD